MRRPRSRAAKLRQTTVPVALVAVLALLAASCSSGTGSYAARHAPTGRKTIFVVLGGDEWAGPQITAPGQLWEQIFYDRELSPRSTLYDLSGQAGTYIADLSSGEATKAAALHPDLVTVWAGLEDLLEGMSAATFGESLRQVLAPLRATGARLLVANVLPIERFSAYSKCLADTQSCDLPVTTLPTPSAVANAIAEFDVMINSVAAAYGAHVVNLTGAFSARLGSGSSGLTDQGDLRLTPAGEQLVAATFRAAYSSFRES